MRRRHDVRMMAVMSYQERPWRIGRKLGRTIYALVGDEPSDDDVLLGIMTGTDTIASVLALRVVTLHNREIERLERE